MSEIENKISPYLRVSQDVIGRKIERSDPASSKSRYRSDVFEGVPPLPFSCLNMWSVLIYDSIFFYCIPFFGECYVTFLVNACPHSGRHFEILNFFVVAKSEKVSEGPRESGGCCCGLLLRRTSVVRII